MNSLLNPYLNFNGNAREAIEFYKTIFGGELAMNTFEEFHLAEDPSDAQKIMHAMLQTDAGMTLMASDTPKGMEYKPGNTVSISLSGDNEEEIKKYWDGLVAGGTIIMPFEEAPWGDTFGMLVDKFGIQWMVNLNSKKN